MNNKFIVVGSHASLGMINSANMSSSTSFYFFSIITNIDSILSRPLRTNKHTTAIF